MNSAEKRRPFNKRRLKNQILNVVTNPFNMIVLVSLVILFCLIIIPLLSMVVTTFTLAQSELRRVSGNVGDFTIYYWKYMLASNMSKAVLWEPLMNSFVCGFFTMLISVPLGYVAGIGGASRRRKIPRSRFQFCDFAFQIFNGINQPINVSDGFSSERKHAEEKPY